RPRGLSQAILPPTVFRSQPKQKNCYRQATGRGGKQPCLPPPRGAETQPSLVGRHKQGCLCPRSDTPRQPVEDLDAAVEGAVVRGVADAEVRVAAAEDAAGDDQQVVADRLGDELAAAAPGRP